MKWLVLIIFAAAACAASILEDPAQAYQEGDRYFYFPGDDNDILHLVDAQDTIDEDFLRKCVKNIAYWLFTRLNPTVPQIILYGNNSSVIDSNFNSSKTTVFLVHGWNGDGQNDMNLLLTEAFLQDDDVNVIVLDWSHLAQKNYVTAKHGVPEVGRALGRLVNWLTILGVSYDKVHLVGFSLGGHLVGSAGRETSSKVKRITSLDPAGPLWISDDSRIAKTDAQYVEIVHTNTAFFGLADTCGDADFYPNGGSSMNGCVLIACSHSRAYEYMASSVQNNHLLAHECGSYGDAAVDNCNGDLYPMGNSDLSKSRDKRKSGSVQTEATRRGYTCMDHDFPLYP